MPLQDHLETDACVNVILVSLEIHSSNVEESANTTKIVLLLWPAKTTNASIHAKEESVASMLSAELATIMPFALAFLATLETPSTDVIHVSYRLVACLLLSFSKLRRRPMSSTEAK